MNHTKIILTGASGFIGRYVLENLSKNSSYQIHCLTHSKNITLTKDNIYQHKVDLLDFSEDGDTLLHNLMNKIKPDRCIHLAWYTGHNDYLTSPLNIKWQEASIRLIKYFYGTGGKRLLAAGTCIEYSLKEQKPHLERTTPIQPESLYAQSKVNVLKYLQELHKTNKINYLWARVYFIYGTGEPPTRLVPHIISSLQNNNTAKPNNGIAFRNYIYVKDLSKQLILLLESEAQGTINTGSQNPIQIQDIFYAIGKILKKEQFILTDEKKLSDGIPNMIAPDLSLFNTYVKNFKYTPLEDGLKEIIDIANNE